MKYQIYDQVNGTKVFDTEAEALAALPAAQAALLEREDYRFCWAIVEVSGSDTIWRSPVESDPENARYQVFNQFTGTHEPFTSRSAAEARRQELKSQFLAGVMLDKVYEYVPPEPPASTVPVEVL